MKKPKKAEITAVLSNGKSGQRNGFVLGVIKFQQATSMDKLVQLLSGGDLRSLGNSNSLISAVQNQTDFDELFALLFHFDRIIVMRAADVIEKITATRPELLAKHKASIFDLSHQVNNKELKWHLALLFPRLSLDHQEMSPAWEMLRAWAKDLTNSRIVRVNSLQGLFELLKSDSKRKEDFLHLLEELQKENIPSLNARIKKLRNKV